jgi:GntR family transcriptional repressor for pyruvate dehydrogenase complex
MSAVTDSASAPTGAISIRPFSPVSRLEEVEVRIKEYIARNELQPGDRLPGEAWFATQLGVGRPLVREALRGLEAVGVIEARKGIGRFVRAFEPGTYLSHFTTQVLIESFSEHEIIETRCLLEIAAVSGAVEQLTDEDLVEIERLWEDIVAYAAKGEANTAADLGLHRVIMSRADNRFIVAMLDAVYALAVGREAELPSSPEKIEEDLLQHQAIVKAALSRNGHAAQAALITHFDTTAARLGFMPSWRNLSVPAPF